MVGGCFVLQYLVVWFIVCLEGEDVVCSVLYYVVLVGEKDEYVFCVLMNIKFYLGQFDE